MIETILQIYWIGDEVLFHEILHNRNFYGTGHTRRIGRYDNMSIYERSRYHANQFFDSYPEFSAFRRESHPLDLANIIGTF